jgi:hypothetical protein
MRNFSICTPCQVVLGSQIIRDKTEGTLDMHEGEEKIIHGCGGEIRRKETT